MRVGVDIDGVLYDFAAGLRNYLMGKCPPVKREYPEPTRWEFYLDWGFSEKEFVEVCNKAVDEHELFWEGAPFPRAVKALRRLVDAGHEIILITDRFFGSRAASKEATEHWLSSKGFEYHELHFTSDKTTVPVDFHIDDKIENHVAMLDAGVESYLLDRPWNQKFATVHRVGSLDGYVTQVLLQTACREAATYMKTDEVTVTSQTGGQKGKKLARFDLIPPRALWQVAELYGKGAEKYDDWNWRKGYDWSLSIAALERHFNQFKQGIDYDDETGCAQLTAVIFHAMTLLTFMEEQRGFDDRFKNPRSEGLKVVSKGDSPPCPCEPVSGAPVASEGRSWACQQGYCHRGCVFCDGEGRSDCPEC